MIDQPIDIDLTALDNPVNDTQKYQALIQGGVQFTVEKKSLLRFLGKSERSFTIREPYLGTLTYLSSIDIPISEEELSSDALTEGKRISREHAKACAWLIAVAVTNGYWKIKLWAPLLATYLYWRLTPQTLLQLTLLVNHLSNFGDFINACRLLSASRTTAPALANQPVDSTANA